MRTNIILVFAALMTVNAANAQLKVSSAGNVTVGSTQESASTLSVNSTGNSNYAAYVNGNCKVDSGFINARVLRSTNIPLYWHQGDVTSSDIANLMALTPKRYSTVSFLSDGSSTSSEENTSEEDNTRLIVTPDYAHFTIPGSNMHSCYPYLTEQDENGNYIVDYAELVPLLVSAYQAIVNYIRENSLSPILSPDSEGVDEDQDTPENQPLLAVHRLLSARLYQNTPNPFSAQTTIRFDLPEDARNAYIHIFDMTGKQLRQIPVTPQQKSVTINAYELSAGMYLYALTVNGKRLIRNG